MLGVALFIALGFVFVNGFHDAANSCYQALSRPLFIYASRKSMLRREATALDQNVTGSIFGGQGSVLGVTAASFHDEDALKSALVR